jgi:hypothetical protein
MNTHEIMSQIRSCESMCEAGKAATAHFLEVCQSDPAQIPPVARFRVRDVRDCHNDLERTYLIRMFAVFEVTLREFWMHVVGRRSHPPVTRVMDGIAARCRMPVGYLTLAHTVREFRNTLVHGGGGRSVTLDEARSHLCRFLSSLPREW